MGLFSGKKTQTTTNRVDIPAFLQPFINQGFGSAGGALSGLSSFLGGATADDLVAGFSPDQLTAFDIARNFATGGSPFLPTAQNALLSVAGGAPAESFLPADALAGLSGFGSLGFLPPEALAALTQTAGGGAVSPLVSQILSRGASNSAVPVEAMNAAGQIINGELIPGASTDALRRTAEGEFLFGGPGFDAAVDAAVRSARPGILSTFGSAGAGAGTGGLAQTAIARSAIDAFANQFGQERSRQLGAASELANLGLAGGQQRLSAAGLLGNLGLSSNAQQLGAAGALADLGLNQQAQRLAGGTALAGLADAERGRQLSAGATQAGLLADVTNAERSRQLQAAGMLPSLGLLGSDVLSQIGSQQQALQQQQLMAPINAQQMLLQAALSGIPATSPFLGSTSTTVQKSSPSALSQLAGLASLAAAFFPPTAALGAIGGLGAGGGILGGGGIGSILSGGGILNG